MANPPVNPQEVFHSTLPIGTSLIVIFVPSKDRDDKAIDQVLSLRAIYTGPEEVIVAAKVHPKANMNIEQLTRAMDDLDRRIRLALPLVADVFIDVTTHRAEDGDQRHE